MTTILVRLRATLALSLPLTTRAMTSPLVLGPILPGDWPTSPTDPSYAGYTAAIRRAALDLVASVSASASDGGDVFERGKVFNESHGCKTETYSAPSSRVKAGGDTQGYKWHVRASRHRDVAYDDFKRGLLENHSVNERDYIEDCEKAEKLQVIKPGEMESKSSLSLSLPTSHGSNLSCRNETVWRMLCERLFVSPILSSTNPLCDSLFP